VKAVRPAFGLYLLLSVSVVRREQIPWADRTHDRCPTCKRIRPVADFPLDRNNRRTATCTTCLARLRDFYRERKGEPVSKERRVRRFKRAQRVVEKALQARIRGEKTKKWWLEARKRWEQGDQGFVQRDIRSFQKGEEYCEGPYRQWVGYTDPREESWREESWEEGVIDQEEDWNSPQGDSTGVSEAGNGPREVSTGPQEESIQEESWEDSTDEGESFTDWQDGWGGFPGESEAWDGPREGSTGPTGLTGL